jgi:hypothetical protein
LFCRQVRRPVRGAHGTIPAVAAAATMIHFNLNFSLNILRGSFARDLRPTQASLGEIYTGFGRVACHVLPPGTLSTAHEI